MDRLKDVGPAKVIGFLPRWRALSPFDQARIWQIYGFAELVVPAHKRVERPVVTAMSKFNLGRANRHWNDEISLRKALWHDFTRNRLRVRLARALRDGSERILRLAFSKVAAGLSDLSPMAALILCEGVDQGKAFRKEVGWPLVSNLDDPRDVEAAFANPAGGVIATMLGANKLGGIAFDVVVRADLGKGLPHLPPGLLESAEANPRPLVVADLDERGHYLLASWSRSRRRAYLTAGWTPAGIDPDIAAWQRFEAVILQRGKRS